MESRMSHIMEELRSERETAMNRLQQLDNLIGAVGPLTEDSPAPTPAAVGKAKRRISAAGMAKIRAAAKRRWAQARKDSGQSSTPQPKKKKKGLHWMQRPENAAKAKKTLAKMRRGYRLKMQNQG